MKKLLGVIAAVLMLAGFAQQAKADNFASMRLDVTLTSTMTVTVPAVSSITSFGPLAFGGSAVSNRAIVVNTSADSITMTLGLKTFNVNYTTNAADGTIWFATDTVTGENYSLQALWGGGAQPLSTAFGPQDHLYLPDGPLCANAQSITPNCDWPADDNHPQLKLSTVASGNGVFEGSSNGVGVPAGSSRNLWFQIGMPTASTRTGDFQLQVTVQGEMYNP